MTSKSKDVGRDIAKLALADARYDTDTLEEVLAYVWDQLCWRKTDADLIELRDTLHLDGCATVSVTGDAFEALVALRDLWPDEFASAIVSECLIERADKNAAKFSRPVPSLQAQASHGEDASA